MFDACYPNLTRKVVEAVAKERKFIPDEVFTTVRQWAFTPTADFIPTRYGPRGLEFLLAKRKEKPWAGCWFFAGGRIVPGETPEQGMVRGCQREFGFAPERGSTSFLLWQSIYNPECEHGGEPYFTMSGVWQVWVEATQKIVLDETQTEYRWFTLAEVAETELPPYVRAVVDTLHRDPARYASWEGRN